MERSDLGIVGGAKRTQVLGTSLQNDERQSWQLRRWNTLHETVDVRRSDARLFGECIRLCEDLKGTKNHRVANELECRR
jgi:hypothetical protein